MNLAENLLGLMGLGTDQYATFALISAIFMLAGFTKGVIAFGLPFVTIPLLSNFIPVPQAVSISLLPIILSNAYQAVFVGSLANSLKRFWPLLAALTVTLLFTTNLMVVIDQRTLLGVVGLIVFTFISIQLLGVRFNVNPERERWIGAGIGTAAGIMGGMSSLFSTPLVLYLTALRLEKNDFVNAISLMLCVGATMIAVMLARFSVLTGHDLALSAYVLIPLAVGYVFGAVVRGRLDQETFMKLIQGFILINGIWLILRGWVL